MDGKRQPNPPPSQQPELQSELERWLSVSGDMDDFIYYGDTSKEHSEK